MGEFDVFCVLCGNTSYQMYTYWIEHVEELIKNGKSKLFTKEQIKKILSTPNILQIIKDLCKKTKWMNRLSFLSCTGEIFHDCEMEMSGVFISKISGDTLYQKISDCNQIDEFPNGYFIHTDCWNYIKSEYKVELNINFIPSFASLYKIDYGIIKTYAEQYFNFINIILDKKQILCFSPLENDKHIKKIITQLKIKNKPLRKSPVVSATFYENGNIKIGKNGKFWIIKNNKWIEIKENLVTNNVILDTKNKKQQKNLRTIPFIGYENTNPIFIKEVNENIVLIMTESYSKQFKT